MARNGFGFAALGIAALLLLLFAWQWFDWQRDDVEPAPGGEPSADSAPSEPIAPAHAVLPATAARTVVPRDGTWWLRSLTETEKPALVPADEDPDTATLRGRLTVRQRPWLHPGGVEVRLTRSWLDTVLPTETGAGGAPVRDEPTAITSADGTFAMRFLPGPGELFFMIDHGGEWMDFQKVRLLPGRGLALDLGDVYLDDRGGLIGVLLDAGDRPVANATLRAVDDPLLDAGSGLDDLRADRTRGLELLAVPGSLRGGPLPDWVVRRHGFLPFPTATTDAAGKFRLRGLRPGTHDVFCQHTVGYASRPQVLIAPLQDTDIGTLRLIGSSAVKVTFVDESHQPWVGAQVAFLHNQVGFGTAIASTSARGEIAIAVADLLATRMVFGYPGGGPWVEVGALPQRQHTVTVPRPASLSVALVDLQGRALSKGSVRFYVRVDMFRPVDRALPEYMQPKERGAGNYEGLQPCQVVIVASVPGFAPGMAVSDSPRMTLTMMPLQTMTVRTHDLHGNVIAGAAIRIQAHANPLMEFVGAQWDALANDRVLVGKTDQDGTLQIPVWPTFFSLQATHPDYAPSAGPKLLPIVGELCNLTMLRGARLFGHLTIEQRAAPAGFRVRARQKPPPGHLLDGSGWLDEQIAVTDTDGSFAFRGLCAGIWELSPELPPAPSPEGARPSARDFQAQLVLLDEEQEMHCVLEAERAPMSTPQILGAVHQNGAPLPGAIVRLRARDDPVRPERRELMRRPRSKGVRVDRLPFATPEQSTPWTHRLATDLFGDFRFTNLEPGREYELRVDVPCQQRLQFVERRIVRTEHSLSAPPTPIDIVLQCGAVHILCLQQGRAFGNRMVRLRQIDEHDEERARFELLTSAMGECDLDALPLGAWTIELVHGGNCEPANFVVRAGANATVVQVTL